VAWGSQWLQLLHTNGLCGTVVGDNVRLPWFIFLGGCGVGASLVCEQWVVDCLSLKVMLGMMVPGPVDHGIWW